MNDGPDDLILVRQAQQELPYRTAAFEQLMYRYASRLQAACRYWVHNLHDAEDLAQDIMLKLFFELPRFREESSFSTWLWRIAANRCIDHCRKQKREGVTDLSPSDCLPGKQRLESEVSSRVDAERLMAKLDESERIVVTLRIFGDLSFEEIASALHIGLSAAKMRYSRALQRLRSMVVE